MKNLTWFGTRTGKINEQMKYRLLSDCILVIFLIYATVFFFSFFNTGSNTKKITDYMIGEPQSQRKKKQKKKQFRSDISSI